MPTALTGHCLCGNVEYKYTGRVGVANYCHCTDCRRCTGGPFSVSIRLGIDDFRIVKGQIRAFTKRAESGNEVTRHFCPECGSPIYTSSGVHPTNVYVKAGTIDDPALVKPSYQSWMSSVVPWRTPAPYLKSYPNGRR